MSAIRLNGTTSGYTEIAPPAVAGDNTVTLPSSNGSANQFLKNGSTAGTLGWSSMVETATGVGIGTTSPAVTAHLAGAASSITELLRLQSNTNSAEGNAVRLAFSSQVALDTSPRVNAAIDVTTDDVGVTHNGAMRFSTMAGATLYERARITSTGSFIFASDDENGIISGTADGKAIVANGSSYSSRSATTLRTHITFTNPNGTVGTIQTQNSATLYNTSSDYRLKENVVPLTGAADRLRQIPVHRFNFIANPDITVDGFLAHEVQAIVPECVAGTKDEVDENGNPVYQGIDQSKLVPLLTAALQEALTEIADLKTRITALEAA